MELLAPAKINLHLRVGPKRSDGFHSLLSWMCSVSLFDNLSFRPAQDDEGVEPGSIRLWCDQPDLPVDRTNLVVRAGEAFLAAVAEDPAHASHATTASGLRATLTKRIPIGAGLGGGSSDGAFTLVALNRLLKADWPVQRLSDFAARFGSDLSFFIHGGSCVCQGRGERVRPIAAPRPATAVLILPQVVMPTPQVYRRFDEMQLGDEAAIEHEPDWSDWTSRPAMSLLPELVNDLEAPAFAIEPRLAHLREQAEQLVGRPVRMSGSGSSLFTIFDALPEADRAAEQLSAGLQVRCVSALLAPTSCEIC